MSVLCQQSQRLVTLLQQFSVTMGGHLRGSSFIHLTEKQYHTNPPPKEDPPLHSLCPFPTVTGCQTSAQKARNPTDDRHSTIVKKQLPLLFNDQHYQDYVADRMWIFKQYIMNNNAARDIFSQHQTHSTDCHFWTSRQLDYKCVPIPSAQNVMVQPGIEPRCPSYMADPLTAELLTTPAHFHYLLEFISADQHECNIFNNSLTIWSWE